MRKQNRLLFLLASLAALALIVILIVTVKSCVEKDVLKDFNRSASLPIALGTPKADLKNVSAYETEEGFGYEILSRDGLRYTLSGYPDALNPYHVTSIEISNGDYMIYGVRVGDVYPENQFTVMKLLGFIPSDGTASSRKFEHGKLSVTYLLDNGTVIGITVRLRTTNITGLAF